MDVTVDDHEVAAALKQLAAAGFSLPVKLKPVVEHNLRAVQAEAMKKTPADGDVSLRRSAQRDVQVIGNQVHAKITYGGLAAKYAEVQHENETFAHTPAEYEQKYGKPLNRNGYTRQTLRGKVGKRGKITIKSKTWKYKRKHRITGYTGGQAHFLYGAPNSAWNDASERRLREAIAAKSAQVLDAALAGRQGNQ